MRLKAKPGIRYSVEAWESWDHESRKHRYPQSEWKRHGLVWTREADNMIPTIGAKQLLINSFLAAGETAITSWFLTLIAAQAGQIDTTASITSGAAVLTLGTAFGTALVVGQVVTVIGAGASGGNLVTTVSVVTSTTSYTLAANAGTTVSAATVIAGPVLAVGDTSASHAGWTEVTTAQVTQTVRPAFTVAVVGTSGANAIKSNSASPSAFTGNTPTWWMTGLALVSTSAFGATTDTLISEAIFDANATPPGAAQVTSGLAISVQATMLMTAA